MTTAISPAVTLDSHGAPAVLAACVLCGAAMIVCDDIDVCSVCGSRRVRSQPKAAASRNASLTAYVDDLLDVLQDVGGMSAAWCETKRQEYETLLRGKETP